MNEERIEAIMQQMEMESKKEPGEKKPNQASQLIMLALDAGIEVYLDQYGDPHVTTPDRAIVGIPVGSTGFRRWLAAKFYKEEGKGFSKETLSQVVSTLEGKAISENVQKDLHTRIARIYDSIYYDLGDGHNIVEITPGSWRVTDESPVRFRHFPHQQKQVTPEEGGDLSLINNYFNLSHEHEILLLHTYLATILVPDIPRASLIITGEQGAAKSTGLNVLRSLIDPSAAALLSPMRDLSGLFETASQHYCLYFDNLSSLSDELSDALCRIVSGCSFSKRKLYTDDEQVVTTLKLAVGLTGINLVANRADLLDRSIILTLERIPNNKRMAEGQFWKKFNADKPKILGAMFSALSQALLTYSSMNPGQLPRMADYAQFATAVVVVLGKSHEEFLTAWETNAQRQNQAALESSPTAQVIIKFMEERRNWRGSATELHKLLQAIAEQSNLVGWGSNGFPKSANHLWPRIQTVKPNLANIGIEAYHGQESAYSVIELRRTFISPRKEAPAMASVATMATKNEPLELSANKDRIKELCLKLQQGALWCQRNPDFTEEIESLNERAKSFIDELEILGVSRSVSQGLLTFPVEDIDAFIQSILGEQLTFIPE